MIFLRAFSVLLGTIIGVGIFGLPFVALKAGFLVVFAYFLVMTSVVIWVHCLYGEVALGTREIHRLPGYVGKYLGRFWKKITFLIITVGFMGALLAYLIIGGEFLGFLLFPYLGANYILYTLLFFVPGAYLILRGIKSISLAEFLLFILLIIILVLFFVKAFPLIDINYFKGIDLEFLAFPYGVILFSLWGAAVIPEIKEMLAKNLTNKKKVASELRKVIIWGIVISAFIYLLFIIIVLGVSGLHTSQEAISGLVAVLGSNIIKWGFVFGIIACFTSFLTLGLTLKKSLSYDFGFSQGTAWLIACFLPLIFFLLGIRQFIDVISFTGAVALGFEGIMIVFLYRQFLKKKFSRRMNPFLHLLTLIFVLGIVFEIFYFLW